MPVTPFHFGPGGALHALAARYVSFRAFCAANVLIDAEPIYYLVTVRHPHHRFFHTYVGATLAGAAAVVLVSRVLRLRLPDRLRGRALTLSQIAAGAAAAAYSHIVLDSVMHADIRPLAPFSDANVLYGIVSVWALHWFCLLCGVVALVPVMGRHLRRKAQARARRYNGTGKQE